MPTIEDDQLVFRFPQHEPNSKFSITFKRTLRIPDTEDEYPLPPGLGSFPLRHTEDFGNKLPAKILKRGGIVTPMWQSEALWLSFLNAPCSTNLSFPVAIKVAAGKINAVTGDPWRSGLHNKPQDYMVSPNQPWLDGFAVEKGGIRQFVAMPLGQGYSVEEQITDGAEWGGLQISVTPLKKAVWLQKKAEREKAITDSERRVVFRQYSFGTFGLGAGGKMRQSIYPDTFAIDDWDVQNTERLFITIINSQDWQRLTGGPVPTRPQTAKEYTKANLPWFDYYGDDQRAVKGTKYLKNIRSVAALFKKKTGKHLPNSNDVQIDKIKIIGPS